MRPTLTLGSTGVDESAVAEYEQHFYRIDPLVRPAYRQPESVLFRSDALVPLEKLVRTEHYNDWMRPQGMHRYLGGWSPLCDDQALTVGFHRSADDPDFDAEVMSRAQTVLPHLVSAADLCLRLRRTEGKLGELRSLLDALPEAAIAVDEHGTWIAHNAAAEALCESAVIGRRLRKLRLGDAAADAQLRLALASLDATTGDPAAHPPELVALAYRAGADDDPSSGR